MVSTILSTTSLVETCHKPQQCYILFIYCERISQHTTLNCFNNISKENIFDIKGETNCGKTAHLVSFVFNIIQEDPKMMNVMSTESIRYIKGETDCGKTVHLVSFVFNIIQQDS